MKMAAMTQPKPRPLKTPTPSNSPVSTATPEHVKAMRAFNRFYTQRIGMLSPYLGSEFSLTEVRILYELAHHPAHAEQPLTATALARTLELDMGYLSRILRRFEGRKWVRRSPAPTDARQSLLTLTAAGFKAFSPLQQRSRDDAASLLDAVPVLQQARVIDAMQTIQSLLQPEGSTPPQLIQPAQAAEPAIVLRDPQPGDLGWVVQQHGEIYAREYGWNQSFEGLVAEVIAGYQRNLQPEWERGWIAEINGQKVGSVFVVRKSKTVAQLRLLILTPQARGLGLGARLTDEVIAFAQAKGYKKLVLWTNQCLTAARAIYGKRGFKLTHTETHDGYGSPQVGETWELKL